MSEEDEELRYLAHELATNIRVLRGLHEAHPRHPEVFAAWDKVRVAALEAYRLHRAVVKESA